MIDREWVDGDDAELEDRAYSTGFTEGMDSLAGPMRSMLSDLAEALREEMEVHDEPSQHLITSVRDWALELYDLGILTEDDKDAYLDMTSEED
jgi:hypothetical protein